MDLTSLVLEATWQGPSPVLSPPPNSASASLIIRTVPSSQDRETFQGTLFLLNQLKTLEAMIACHTQQEKTPWAQTEGARLDEGRLDKFFAEAQDPAARGAGGQASQNDVTLLNALEVISSLPVRADLDFTEKFWNLCSVAADEEDLRTLLAATFEQLGRGEIFPMVHKNNSCVLATLIRDAIRLSRVHTARDYNEQKEGLAKSYQQWTQQALACVIDTGLCKLRRDYAHYLVGHDVATWEGLEFFLDSTPSFEEQIRRLEGLHRVFEIFALLRAHAPAIPFESLRRLVREALTLFTNPAKASEVVTFTLTLPKFSSGTTTLLTAICQSLEPALWSVSLTAPQQAPATGAAPAAPQPSAAGHSVFRFSKRDPLFRPPHEIDLSYADDDAEMQLPEVSPDSDSQTAAQPFHLITASLHVSQWSEVV